MFGGIWSLYRRLVVGLVFCCWLFGCWGYGAVICLLVCWILYLGFKFALYFGTVNLT